MLSRQPYLPGTSIQSLLGNRDLKNVPARNQGLQKRPCYKQGLISFRGNNPSRRPSRKRPPEDLPQDQYKGLGCHRRWIGAVRSISRSVCGADGGVIFMIFGSPLTTTATAPLSFWTSRQPTLRQPA